MSEPKETREMRKRRRAQTLANLLGRFFIMVRYCSWCGRIIGFRRGGTGITDCMCDRCYKKLTEAENGKAYPETLHHQDTS